MVAKKGPTLGFPTAARARDVARKIDQISAKPRARVTSVEIIDPVTRTTRSIVGQQPDGTFTTVDVFGIAPPQPSVPTVSVTALTIRVAWDGLTATGVQWPADLANVEVHMWKTGSSNFDVIWDLSRAAILGKSANGITISVSPDEWNLRLVAVNTSGNRSTPTSLITLDVPDFELESGAQVFVQSGTPTATKVNDLWVKTPENVTYYWDGDSWEPVQDQAIISAVADARKAYAAAENIKVLNGDFELLETRSYGGTPALDWPLYWRVIYWQGSPSFTNRPRVDTTAANVISGASSLQLNAVTNDAVQMVSEPFGVAAGTTVTVAAKVRLSRALAAGTFIKLRLWTATTNAKIGALSDPEAVVFDVYSGIASGTTLQQLEGQVTIPAGFKVAAVGLQAYADGGAVYSAWFDDVEVRRVVSEFGLGADSVSTVKLQNLAVSSAKIASLDVGKLTAGTMTAAIVNAGSLKSATTGARYEIDALGIRLYNATVQTVNLNSSTGDALLTGTVATGPASQSNRIEMTSDGGGGVMRIYTTDSAETKPATIASSASNASEWEFLNGQLWLTSPQRGSGQEQMSIALRGSSSGVTGQINAFTGRGDLHVFGKASGTGTNESGGAIFLRNNSNNTAWAELVRYGSGLRVNAQLGEIYLFTPSAITLSSPDNKTVGAFTITGGGLTHSGGGPVTLQDTFVRTGTFTANVGIASTPQAVLYRITSRAAYKVNIADADFTADDVRKLVPRIYQDRSQFEDKRSSNKYLSWHLGLIADEVAKTPMAKLLVERDINGEPDAVNYDRVGVALIPWLQDIDERLTKAGL